MLGKVPPQAVDIEQAVLGAIIIESRLFDDVVGLLKPESFYKETHQKIFGAILELSQELKPIDMLTVINSLRDSELLEEVGGAYYIAELTKNIASGSHIIEHAKIVAEKYIRREIIRLSHEMNSAMYDENNELYAEILQFQNDINGTIDFTAHDELHISEAIDRMVEHSIKLNKNEITKGIKTGYTYFDEFSGGLQRGDLMVIAGETSNGKTTLAINIQKNSCVFGTKSAIFSYEMTPYQLSARFLAHDQKVNSKDIIRGNIDEHNLTRIANNAFKLSDSDIYINKPKGTGFEKLIIEIRRMVKLYNLDLIVIDYLQLISNMKRNGSTADQIADVANVLKALSVELDVATILISQLKRDGNPKPTLGRLKGSGDIENAADIVMFVYWPAKYGNSSAEINGVVQEIEENEAITTVAKGRNIGTCEFLLRFEKEIPAFFNHIKNEVPFDVVNYSEPRPCPFGE